MENQNETTTETCVEGKNSNLDSLAIVAFLLSPPWGKKTLLFLWALWSFAHSVFIQSWFTAS